MQLGNGLHGLKLCQGMLACQSRSVGCVWLESIDREVYKFRLSHWPLTPHLLVVLSGKSQVVYLAAMQARAALRGVFV